MTTLMKQDIKEISIQYVKGVGPAKKKLFSNLGIETVEDMLYFFPRRYEDRRHLTKIAQVNVGDLHCVSGKIKKHTTRKSWHTKKAVTEVIIDDGSGCMTCVWFNQPYLENYFKEGKNCVIYGKVDSYKDRLQMVSPEYEIIEGKDEDSLAINRIVPIYPLTRGMTQRYLRKVVSACLVKYKGDLVDELPVDLRNKHHLSNIKRSIDAVHFPEDFKYQDAAIKRISFEEFFFFQVSVILRRMSITQKKGIDQKISDGEALKFIDGFGFELTNAQRKVIREIREDMQKPIPMLRLLQGDVGSGKTIVAAFGFCTAFENSHQSCLMAPTEILARQHFETIQEMIDSGPLKGMKCALLISSVAKKDKDQLLKGIEDGEIDLVIGTHALINEEVTFKDLSYAVIDEQHKFGVRQRALLSKKGSNPDVLIMTATPIPRTLCITLYGDLDVSIIDEMPAGRGKIKTKLFSFEKEKDVYLAVRQEVKQGRQAYIVYPIIEESHTLDLKAAQKMYQRFQKQEFKDCRVGLVHGQMKKNESEIIMKNFKKKKLDILCATTVLEVGVDVPNASVMVIEHAERFGLSQLHQLRGRIGRGKTDSLCLLLADAQTEEGKQRLDAILATNDGFKIAQADLEIRGPGRYFGRHQHGLNELKVANPATQLDILELARKEAVQLVEKDPKLNTRQNHQILKVIKKRYPTYLEMVQAG